MRFYLIYLILQVLVMAISGCVVTKYTYSEQSLPRNQIAILKSNGIDKWIVNKRLIAVECDGNKIHYSDFSKESSYQLSLLPGHHNITFALIDIAKVDLDHPSWWRANSFKPFAVAYCSQEVTAEAGATYLATGEWELPTKTNKDGIDALNFSVNIQKVD